MALAEFAAPIGATHETNEVLRHRPALGPISRRLIARTTLIYAFVFVLGLLPSLLDLSANWKAAGLGLILPGGGFASWGAWGFVFFALTVALFAGGMFLWFLTGAATAPALVWLASAVWAGMAAGDVANPHAPFVVSGLALAFIGSQFIFAKRREARLRVQQMERNAYLPGALAELSQRAEPAPPSELRELSTDELAGARYLLDRALQPIKGFSGFDIIDQFQTAALRYQITFSQFALGVLQRHYTPQFRGYLSQAQRNLIEKFLERKVWDYWILENLWGNLNANCDPVARDNIMLGGFYNGNVSLYTANTGDTRYLARGSLPFRLNRKTVFEHDAHSLARVAHENFNVSPLCLYPCEPHLSYPFCNLVGFSSLTLSDRALGTNYASAMREAFAERFETEFTRVNGDVQSGRSRLLGFALPHFTGVFGDAGYSWLGNAVFPDVAKRTWAIVREEFVRFDESGEIVLTLRAGDKMDGGNYRRNESGAFAQILCAAREHGDTKVAEAILRRLDREFTRVETPGIGAYSEVSHYNNIFVALGRFMRQGDWRAAVCTAPQLSPDEGPILEEVAYPDVLVAKAYSGGADLQLVLYPGGKESRQTIGIERLSPGGRYRVRGALISELTADAAGRAKIDVELTGRTAVTIQPN